MKIFRSEHNEVSTCNAPYDDEATYQESIKSEDCERVEDLLEIIQNMVAAFQFGPYDYKSIAGGLEAVIATLLHRPSLATSDEYIQTFDVQSCVPDSAEALLQLVEGSAYAFIKTDSPRAAMMHLLSSLKVPDNMNLHIILDPPDISTAYERDRSYSCKIRLVSLDPASVTEESTDEEVYMGPDFGREAELDALTPPPFIYSPMRVTLQQLPWVHTDERDYFIYLFIWSVDD